MTFRLTSGVVVALLAVTEAPATILDPVARLSATAVLGVTLFVLVTKTLPALGSSFLEETKAWREVIAAMETQRHDDEEERHRRLELLTATLASLEATLTRLREHCEER